MAPAVPTKAEFRSRVEAVIAGLAPGEVVSYGDVAEEAGYPGAARGVGAILANPTPETPEDLPWWRVVTATGRLVPGHESPHTRLLEAEGVEIRNGRVARGPRPATGRAECPGEVHRDDDPRRAGP